MVVSSNSTLIYDDDVLYQRASTAQKLCYHTISLFAFDREIDEHYDHSDKSVCGKFWFSVFDPDELDTFGKGKLIPAASVLGHVDSLGELEEFIVMRFYPNIVSEEIGESMIIVAFSVAEKKNETILHTMAGSGRYSSIEQGTYLQGISTSAENATQFLISFYCPNCDNTTIQKPWWT